MQNLVSSHLGASDFSYIDKAYKNASYDNNLRILLIHFHTNNSVYAYNNVGSNTYKQFLQAPSQGRYFWQHIRQNKTKYPYILVTKGVDLITQAHFEYAFKAFNLQGKGLSPVIEHNALYDVYPDLKKLDKLDATQKALDEQYGAGKIDESAYYSACEKIENDKQKCIDKLTQLGYFETEPDEQESNKRIFYWTCLFGSVCLFCVVCYAIVKIFIASIPLLVLICLGLPILLLGKFS